MRSRWSLALFLVCLFVSPTVSAAWNQYQGNEERNGLLEPFPALLDVLEVGALRNDTVDLGSVEYAPVILRSNEGWIWSERHPGHVCQVVQRAALHDPDTEVSVTTEGCDTGLLQGFDSPTQRTLICSWAREEEIVLRAVQPDGRFAWSLTPNELGLISTSYTDPTYDYTDTSDGDVWWQCQGTAMDIEERVAYVAFYTNDAAFKAGVHRLFAFDLDTGRPLWSTEVHDNWDHDGVTSGMSLGAEPPNEGGEMYVGGITLVDDALIVAYGKTCWTCWDGNAGDGGGRHTQAAFAWFERETGRQVGIADRDAAEGDVDVTYHVAGSRFAAARDGLAVFYHWDRAVFVDPQLRDPVMEIPIRNTDARAVATAAPVWWNQYAIVPAEQWLSAIHADRREVAWEWSGGPNWNIEHVAVSQDGDLLVLVVDRGTDETAKLVRLSAATGTVRQEIPLQLDVHFDSGFFFAGNSWRVDMVQDASGGVAIVDSLGSYARVGAAPHDIPLAISVSESYPSRGDAVEVRLDSPTDGGAGLKQIQVLWGEGTRRTYAPGETMVHAYPDDGDHDIVATMIFEDATTRSATATVHVGGTPPSDLNALQRAFAPDNLDMTWGVIGVLIALFGGLMAIARSRVRKNRLEYKLQELERLKKRAEHDVPGAIRAMTQHRDELRQDLSRGKVDDIQYAVLEGEIQRSLRLWYHRLLAPYETRMSDRFRRTLTASLEDGTLHAPEAGRLATGLAAETRLKRDEKDRLRAFFEEWSAPARG